MKEEAWKKSSRSRISTKEAFKIKVDCLRQFFFLGLVHDHPVWYIYIYMIYVDVLIGMCTICTSLYIYIHMLNETYLLNTLTLKILSLKTCSIKNTQRSPPSL